MSDGRLYYNKAQAARYLKLSEYQLGIQIENGCLCQPTKIEGFAYPVWHYSQLRAFANEMARRFYAPPTTGVKDVTLKPGESWV